MYACDARQTEWNDRKLTTLMIFVCRERYERFHRRRKKGPATLNKNYRKADMMRITEENKKLLMRIANVEPTFRRDQWKKRERKHASCCVR